MRSYLKVQFNCEQQSDLLNDLLQIYDLSISDEPYYVQYNDMVFYHNFEYMAQLIQQNESFYVCKILQI